MFITMPPVNLKQLKVETQVALSCELVAVKATQPQAL